MVIVLYFAVIAALFFVLIVRPQRRQAAARRALIQALSVGDDVITAGGIYGVITNIHREADEVTIKVDEATNTKLRVTLGSIARVLGEETSEKSASQ